MEGTTYSTFRFYPFKPEVEGADSKLFFSKAEVRRKSLPLLTDKLCSINLFK